MEYSISVVEQGTTDLLAGLGDVLLGRDELHGRVRYIQARPVPGTMGPIVEELRLLLENKDQIEVLGTVLLGWLISRRRKITIRLERKETKAEFTLVSADEDTEAAVRDLVTRLGKELADNPDSAQGQPDGGA